MKSVSRFLTIAVVLTGAIFLWLLSINACGVLSVNDSLAVVAGNVGQAASGAQYFRRSNPEKTIELVVGLKLRNQKELRVLLASQRDPGSANFRKYLSPSEFNQRFAPDPVTYDQVIGYLRSQGMQVVSTTPNRLLIVVRGTVAQVERTFNVNMHDYLWNSRVYTKSNSDPKLPQSLAAVVESVMGLNDFVRFRPLTKRLSSLDADEPWGLTPQQVAAAYNFPNSNNSASGVKYSGHGYNLAIATAYGYDAADVQTFWKQFGITRTGNIENIPVGGTSLKPGAETTLDLEQAGAQAPGANILMYMAVDTEDSTFAQVFNQIVTDNRADVVSFSWGLAEEGLGLAAMKTFSAIYTQAAAQGINIFCASGDNGAYDGGPKQPLVLAVDYPSADPNVTGVGGTTLNLNDDGSRAGESVWSGAGGGISNYWAKPGWQTGPGVPAGDKRAVADVALVSDPWTGYACYIGGGWQLMAGGTSFASPNWAALWVLSEEACGKRLGDANATFYRIGGNSRDYALTFRDIVTGNNGARRGPGYKAGPNWDHPTGWGVPNGAQLIEWLKKDVENTPAK